MYQRLRVPLAVLGLSIVLGGVAVAQLGDLLKAGGVAFAVDKFGPDINKALNKLTKTPEDNTEFATKVVPIISGGGGKQVGACQVMGPIDAVEKVKAVAQIEAKFGPLGIRIRALIPIAAKSISDIRRVPGVGISGLVDIKI